VLAGLAVAGLSVAGGTALAAEPDGRLATADLGAEVTVGFGRGTSEFGWAPIEVTLSPRVPVAGTLEVRSDGSLGSSQHQEPIEVAAGATKVVHLLAPPGGELQVSFRPTGGAPLRLPPAGRQTGAVLVGAIGPAPALPDTLTCPRAGRAGGGGAGAPPPRPGPPESYQYTDTPAGTFWDSVQTGTDADGHHFSVTVGVPYAHAKWFRGRDTQVRRSSTCPDPACCQRPPAALARRWEGVAWPSARMHQQVLAALPRGAFPGVDDTDVFAFLQRHAPTEPAG
jgi:hypothetical protein